MKKTRGQFPVRAFETKLRRWSGLDRQFDVDRPLFLAEGPAQLRQRNVLQLPNPLAGHTKFLADFLEGLRLAAIEPEARENDLALAIVEHVEQSAHFVPQILVAEQFERR